MRTRLARRMPRQATMTQPVSLYSIGVGLPAPTCASAEASRYWFKPIGAPNLLAGRCLQQTPHRPYEYTIDFWRPTGNVFARVHRIRIEITSSYRGSSTFQVILASDVHRVFRIHHGAPLTRGWGQIVNSE